MNKLQATELEILIQIINVLKKHNLKYYAIGGTCLGAIRHQGFIPWDDDIDIAMPRKDYELFKTVYYKELPDYLCKHDYDDCEENDFLFLKIFDKRTTYIEKEKKKQISRYGGIFVDIMPVDILPDNNSFIVLKLYVFFLLNKFRRFKFKCIHTDLGIIILAKDLIKATFGIILRPFFQFNHFSNIILKTLRNNESGSNALFTWRLGIEKQRLIFSNDFFSDTVNISFENIEISVPQNYNNYLEQDFGDYMQLPPENERKPNHNYYICDLDTPYEHYAQIEREKMNK